MTGCMIMVDETILITLPSLTRDVRTTEGASPKFAYLVLRNTRRPNVKSPDYFPNLLDTWVRDGNADNNRSGGKKFLGHIFSGNFGGKTPYVSQNKSLPRPFWVRGVFVLMISNINIGFHKLLTLPLIERSTTRDNDSNTINCIGIKLTKFYLLSKRCFV